MLDLGAWIDEEYSLPSETTELSDEEFSKLEEALNERQKAPGDH